MAHREPAGFHLNLNRPALGIGKGDLEIVRRQIHPSKSESFFEFRMKPSHEMPLGNFAFPVAHVNFTSISFIKPQSQMNVAIILRGNFWLASARSLSRLKRNRQ
jgi:hypothetical protein